LHVEKYKSFTSPTGSLGLKKGRYDVEFKAIVGELFVVAAFKSTSLLGKEDTCRLCQFVKSETYCLHMPTNLVPWVLRRTLPTCGTERNAEYVTGTGIVETMELIAWLGMFDPQPRLSDMAVLKSIIIWCRLGQQAVAQLPELLNDTAATSFEV
jgi:hypothetical protein